MSCTLREIEGHFKGPKRPTHHRSIMCSVSQTRELCSLSKISIFRRTFVIRIGCWIGTWRTIGWHHWRGLDDFSLVFVECPIWGGFEVSFGHFVSFVGDKAVTFAHEPFVDAGLRRFSHVTFQPFGVPFAKISLFTSWYCFVRL